jgi:hypothetical protein
MVWEDAEHFSSCYLQIVSHLDIDIEEPSTLCVPSCYLQVVSQLDIDMEEPLNMLFLHATSRLCPNSASTLRSIRYSASAYYCYLQIESQFGIDKVVPSNFPASTWRSHWTCFFLMLLATCVPIRRHIFLLPLPCYLPIVSGCDIDVEEPSNILFPPPVCRLRPNPASTWRSQDGED